MAARGDRRINTTSYEHPQEIHLLDLHYAMQYNANGEPIVRVGLDGNDVVITGNVTIPGTIQVFSNIENPVHTHITEVGTSGNLQVPWLPIAGNVTVDSGNITVNQGTSPWVVSGTVATNVGNFPDVSVTAFEEPLAVGITPVIQGMAVYGLDPDFWAQNTRNSGTISVTPYNLFQVASGTSAGGYARLASTSYVTYQPGQGMMFRWTAAFTTTTDANATTRNATGITSIVQNTGPIDRESGFSIGYSGVAGSKIGILHRRAGFVETRVLTITQQNTGAQTANVTLDGTSYSISLSTSSSTSYCAHQIAQKLKANVTAKNTWDIDACGSTVTFVYYSPGARTGTFSLSSSGTGTLAAGTFTQLQAGATPVDTWTYVDSWNGTVPNFDPTKLNVYGMDMRWLGSGRIRFFMEDPDTGKMVKIHTITWTKDQTGLYPHIRNPALRIVYRSGTTNPAVTPSANVIVSGSSIFGAIQGMIQQTGMSQGYYDTSAGNKTQNVVHHLLSIQNPVVRNGLVNKSSLVMQDLTVSAQGNDPSVIFIVKNAVGTSDLLQFQPLPITNGFYFAQFSNTDLTENLALDSPANIQTLPINGSAAFDLKPYNMVLNAGDYISVFLLSTSPITRTATGFTWKVD